ncbi:MAG: hypothetical protein CMG74_10550 [Candidatus Marinimicrobia bacterium]|nr:hypothetical protein [Candidatus Neomarinimicrobiota bacterium]|tara:strand:+ start:22975 stop:23211 length:237 start_codon:yes stop_codon:yes gene_type:complete
MDDYKNWLMKWLQKRNNNLNINENDDYISCGAIDSLGIIEFVEDIEENFSISFTQNHLQDRRFRTVNGLAEIIFELIK